MGLFHSRRQFLSKTFKAGLVCFLAPKPLSSSLKGFGVLSENLILQRIIPATGEKIPVIGMGTWQTFDVGNHQGKRTRLKEVLKIFAQKGGKVIDSSPMYGSSEKVVGDLSTQLGLQNDFFLATKVWTSGEEQGKSQMNKSMDLLNTAKLDLMQVHNLVDYKVHLKTLMHWKNEGKIRYTGITHYTTSAYKDLMRVMKEFKVDFVQFNYSIRTRDAENSILPFAADHGVAVIINRPFEGGALFSTVKQKTLPEWVAEMDCKSWAQFFLKFIVSHPAVTCAIPATGNPKHMHDNMEAAFGKLPDKVMRNKMVDHFSKF